MKKKSTLEGRPGRPDISAEAAWKQVNPEATRDQSEKPLFRPFQQHNPDADRAHGNPVTAQGESISSHSQARRSATTPFELSPVMMIRAGAIN